MNELGDVAMYLAIPLTILALAVYNRWSNNR